MPARFPRRLDPDRLGDHVDRLFRAAWALCGNRHDAEDLVQETFARVLARPRFLRHDDDVAYLMKALRNTFASSRRRAGRRVAELPLDDEVVDPGAPAPDLPFEVAELFAAISALPPGFRDALAAVDVAGLGYAEAARALGIKEATLTTRLHRARRRVARALTADPEVAERR